jgi:hypothetical protein
MVADRGRRTPWKVCQWVRACIDRRSMSAEIRLVERDGEKLDEAGVEFGGSERSGIRNRN